MEKKQTIQKIKQVGVSLGKRGRNFSRSVKRKVIHLLKFARGRGEKAKACLIATYSELMSIARKVMDNIKEVKRQATRKAKKIPDIITRLTLHELTKELDHWKHMLSLVLAQTHERIINGNTHYPDKILSIFESHSVAIKKGKAGKKVEFGKKIEITEAENKVITDYKILEGNMSDAENLPDIVDRHIKRFGKPPNLVAHDRGGWTPHMEQQLKAKGVKRVSIPAKGRRSEERKRIEKERWFKNAQKFRAGSEGTISKGKRVHGLDRCLYQGEDGMEVWTGLGVIAMNLITIAKYQRA
jgi:IS5 family transposase